MRRSIEDDIWAFGVTILVAGTVAGSPFSDLETKQILRFSPLKYLRKYARYDWTPDQVELVGVLCSKMLAYHPNDRIGLQTVITELKHAIALGNNTTSSSSSQVIGYGNMMMIQTQPQQPDQGLDDLEDDDGPILDHQTLSIQNPIVIIDLTQEPADTIKTRLDTETSVMYTSPPAMSASSLSTDDAKPLYNNNDVDANTKAVIEEIAIQ